MKKTHRKSSAPALAPAENKLDVNKWSAIQFEASRRDTAVTAILKERDMAQTETVKIELPSALVGLIAEAFRFFEIPASQIPQGIARAVLATHLTDSCSIWSGYIYPSRAVAQRVADKVFCEICEQPSIALSFHRRGKVVSELFRNPLATLNAA